MSNYTIRHDEYGHATAIEREGYTVLHLLSGTERNEQEVEGIVRELNGVQRLRAALEKARQYVVNGYELGYIDDREGYTETLVREIDKALSTTTEQTGPYTVRRDVTAGINTKGQPFAVAIERNGYTVLHLQPGTERNEGEVEHIVDLLNNRSPEQHLMWEIKGLLEQWDFRGIAEQLESGYDQGVLVELVELCEKLTGAKSPRVNAPEGDGNDA